MCRTTKIAHHWVFFSQFYDIENLVIFPKKLVKFILEKKNPNAFLEKNKNNKKFLFKKNTITNELTI